MRDDPPRQTFTWWPQGTVGLAVPRQFMRLASLHDPLDHPDWIFELKYDGFRALAHVGQMARALSRATCTL